jgi:nucleotide-binding universal stress UspA family protein
VRQTGPRHAEGGAAADPHPRRVRRQPHGQPRPRSRRHPRRRLDLPLVAVCVSSSEQEGRVILGEAESYLEPHRLRLKAVLETGAPVEGILQVAQREACDLIIMGAFGHSRVRELFVGSTTDGILRAAEIPVLLYR